MEACRPHPAPRSLQQGRDGWDQGDSPRRNFDPNLYTYERGKARGASQDPIDTSNRAPDRGLSPQRLSRLSPGGLEHQSGSEGESGGGSEVGSEGEEEDIACDLERQVSAPFLPHSSRLSGSTWSSAGGRGENFYSRISDDAATLPRPTLFIPPPPTDPAPPMPPRGPGFPSRGQGDFLPPGYRDELDDESHMSPVLPSFPHSRPSRPPDLHQWIAPPSAAPPSADLIACHTPSVRGGAVHTRLANKPPEWQAGTGSTTSTSAGLSTTMLPQSYPSTDLKDYPSHDSKLRPSPCRHCSWRSVALILVVISLSLIVLIAYLTVSRYHSEGFDSWSGLTSSHQPTHDLTSNDISSSSSHEPVVQYPLGRWLTRELSPRSNWRTQFYLADDQYTKFNVRVRRGAVVGVYARRGARPSHTQYDFLQVVQGEPLTGGGELRHRRSVPMDRKEVGGGELDVRFIQYMEGGLWFVFLYNDNDQNQTIAFLAAQQQVESVTKCPNDCHGRGKCTNSQCQCFTGYTGVDCRHSSCPVLCSGHGVYLSGSCLCYEGWRGAECSVSSTHCADSRCGGRGECVRGACVCAPGFTGESCETEMCKVDCLHGVCVGGRCECGRGWEGEGCDLVTCNPRCVTHGSCNNGSCLCNKGWNGKHCSIEGCVGMCSGHGTCKQQQQLGSADWSCVCDVGYSGSACSSATEILCDDGTDDDADGLVDCEDVDCCASVVCRGGGLCGSAPDPKDILLRKQPPSSTASFYERMKFLIEDDSVQSYATLSSFNHSQVSVMRGRVGGIDGGSLTGVRVSVVTQPLYGFTLTREHGLFDILVNGGGSVTLSFQRQPYHPQQVTFMVPWNQIITMNPVTLTLPGQQREGERGAECPSVQHDRYSLQPRLRVEWREGAGSVCPERSATITESQVLQESIPIPGSGLYLIYHSTDAPGYMSTVLIHLTPPTIPNNLSIIHLRVHIEGVVYERSLEAEPSLSHTFSWDRRNAYNQKVYGVVPAVGYEYEGCSRVYWEVRWTSLGGFDISSSEVGGWNINIHHTYNFQEGIIHLGDGSNVYLRDRPRTVVTVMGNGKARKSDCKNCDGKAGESKLLAPVALASGRDGSVYVGDFNLIRKLSPNREDVTSILQLQISEVPYRYFMTVSPLDGKLYISDHYTRRIVRVKTMGSVRDLTSNYEVVAGTGEQCLPGDPERCGDGGPAVTASLSYPKGIAITKDGVIYFADGANIRQIDQTGAIRTVIGSQGFPGHWSPLPCNNTVRANQVTLRWPTSLSINPLDDSLYVLDNDLILRLTHDLSVFVVLGSPSRCPSTSWGASGGAGGSSTSGGAREGAEGKREAGDRLESAQHITFSPSGDLFVVQSNQRDLNRVLMIDTQGHTSVYMGGTSGCDCSRDSCQCFNSDQQLATQFLLHDPTSVTMTPDLVLHVADMGNLRVHSVHSPLPQPNKLNQYEVTHPHVAESYLFNRYGQHIATRSLATGSFTYNFTYTVNSYYGKLLKIESGGLKLLTIKRDYRLQAKELIPLSGLKCSLTMDNMGLLQSWTGADNSSYRFSYHGSTGLIGVRETGGGGTQLYGYRGEGRLNSVTYDNGHVTSLLSSRTDLNYSDGSFNFPTGASVKFSSTLISNQPVTVQRYTSLPSGHTHNITWYYYTGEGAESRFDQSERRETKLIATLSSRDETMTSHSGMSGKSLVINGEVLLGFEFNRSSLQETILNNHHEEILSVMYDGKGRPKTFTPKHPLVGCNITYNRWGGLAEWRRGEMWVAWVAAEDTGLVVERRVSNRPATRYIYKHPSGVLLTDVILSSGKQYQIKYDDHSNLLAIITPNLHTHDFFQITLSGITRLGYTPPGRLGSFYIDYNSQNKPLRVIYPSQSKRVTFRYDDQERVTSVFYDNVNVWTKYGAGLVVEGVGLKQRTGGGYSYNITYQHSGPLIMSQRVRIQDSSDVTDVRFDYSYDDLFRVVSLSGKISDHDLQPQHMNYSRGSRLLTSSTPLVFDIPSPHREVTRDQNVEITREYDTLGRQADLWVSFNNYVVFSVESKYDALNRVYQWRRKVGSSDIKAYEYVYDTDSNVIEVLVNGHSTWKYEIDVNNNIVKILYYNQARVITTSPDTDRVVLVDEKSYQYDGDGFVVRRDGETFTYNSQGQITRSYLMSSHDVIYQYDPYNRLSVIKEVITGRIVKLFYADLTHTTRVTHSVSAGKLSEYFYDRCGNLVSIRQGGEYFYVGADVHGSPALVLNSVGSVVTQYTYDPLGNKVPDSGSDFNILFGFRGGIIDGFTNLVIFDGRAYDPSVGRWMGVDYIKFLGSVEGFPTRPQMMNPYRHSSIHEHIDHHRVYLFDNMKEWLNTVGFDFSSTTPLTTPEGYLTHLTPPSILPPVPHLSPTLLLSSHLCSYEQLTRAITRLSLVTGSEVTGAQATSTSGLHVPALRASFAPTDSLFGRGVVLAVEGGVVNVKLLDAAAPLLAKLAVTLLNNSAPVGVTYTAANRLTAHYTRADLSEVSKQLSNLSLSSEGLILRLEEHEITLCGDRLCVRVGEARGGERNRVIKLAGEGAVEAAWALQKEAVKGMSTTTYPWSRREREELVGSGRVRGVGTKFLRDIELYPELCDDLNNVMFVKLGDR